MAPVVGSIDNTLLAGVEPLGTAEYVPPGVNATGLLACAKVIELQYGLLS